MSTRGDAAPVGFADAMMEGLAPDGGLYVPEELPELSTAQLAAWEPLSYADLATEIIGLLAPDMDRGVIATACQGAYSPNVFSSDAVAPVRRLGLLSYMLELSHGPTLAFKDMAMQLLGRLFDAELERRGDKLIVVGATSGDTGSSAEHAMVGRHNIGVVMLSPWGRVSPFQAAQMYSLDEPNIVNLAIDGVFDEAQDLVKAVNADDEFKRQHSIGAVNSINWARVAAQVVYYVWGYLRVVETRGDRVQFVVPTGNFGNIYAGIVARRMGLPLRFILATNENDVLDEFFRTGRYRVRSADTVTTTSSPSMDIAKASNFERFVFDLHDGDGAEVSRLWQQLEEAGEFDLAGHRRFGSVAEWLVSGSSTHADRIAAIRRMAVEHGRLIDPHTADGITVGSRLADPDLPVVYLETAQPVKFAETIVEALGQAPPPPPHLAGLEDASQNVTRIAPDVDAVRRAVETLSARMA